MVNRWWWRVAVSLVVVMMLMIPLSAQAQSQMYVVQYGDTLFSIAQHYGVTVDALRQANGLAGNLIYAGQTLTIPDDSDPAPVPIPGSTMTHLVTPGETLFTIGLRYGLQWTLIAQANGIVGDRVYAGQVLTIPLGNTNPPATPTAPPPPTAPAPPAPTATPAPVPTQPPAGQTVTHIVQRGETLFSIGVRYGLLWTTIAQANGIVGNTIYAGQQLLIPLEGSVPPGPMPTAAPPPPTGMAGRYFVVDLSDQMLYAYEGDTVVHSTLISSGVWPYPTVTGTYNIYLRYPSQTMYGYGYYLPDVPYVMYFYQGYALHGTYWHNNFGTPMSHGCVNMPTAEAEWAYNWSSYGTPVVVQW